MLGSGAIVWDWHRSSEWMMPARAATVSQLYIPPKPMPIKVPAHAPCDAHGMDANHALPTPRHASPRHATPCSPMPCHAMPCRAVPFHSIPSRGLSACPARRPIMTDSSGPRTRAESSSSSGAKACHAIDLSLPSWPCPPSHLSGLSGSMLTVQGSHKVANL